MDKVPMTIRGEQELRTELEVLLKRMPANFSSDSGSS